MVQLENLVDGPHGVNVTLNEFSFFMLDYVVVTSNIPGQTIEAGSASISSTALTSSTTGSAVPGTPTDVGSRYVY